ncbi:hypothetical protein J4458_01155 [Candidatus Woesearchaeota archaeon]|nr:hypothetical protein [Candidatus Woesearchaeota archaeon]
MGKNGTFSAVAGVAILLIFLVVVLLYLLGPEAILPRAAKAADWIADKTLSGLRKEKLEQKTFSTEKGTEEAYDSVLNVLRSGGSGPCRIERRAFAGNFKGFRITLSKSEQGTFVQLMNEKGQSLKQNTISGRFPCVVGEGDAAINFYNNHLSDNKCSSNCPKDYTIANIEFKAADSIYVDGKKRNLDDENLLFKTADGNVCFFPTYAGVFTLPGCDAGTGGLDDDCIGAIKNNIKSC